MEFPEVTVGDRFYLLLKSIQKKPWSSAGDENELMLSAHFISQILSETVQSADVFMNYFLRWTGYGAYVRCCWWITVSDWTLTWSRAADWSCVCSSLQLMNNQPEKPFIRNKAAQVFALTFIMEYLTLWPKFFFDILSLVGLNPHGIDIYLRTLMAIDGEVVDRDILHSPEVRPAHLPQTSCHHLVFLL